MDKYQYEKIAKKIVDAAYQVHKEMGPGLLESVYELCLIKELELQKIKINCQVIKEGIKRYVNNY